MSGAAATSVLVVANRTASTPMLLDEVSRRAESGARFFVCVPPERGDAAGDDWTPDVAADLLERAAGAPVERVDPGPDALDTIHREVSGGTVDELIVSTAPEHLRRWVHHDLPHRLRHLGVPVRIIPPEPDQPLEDDVAEVMHDDWTTPPLPGSGGGGAY
jgi:hypothetical protein